MAEGGPVELIDTGFWSSPSVWLVNAEGWAMLDQMLEGDEQLALEPTLEPF